MYVNIKRKYVDGSKVEFKLREFSKFNTYKLKNELAAVS